MPQFRKLHVKITESQDVNNMPDDFHRLLWTWLPLCVCKEGRGFMHGGWLKGKLMPFRGDVTEDKIIQAMSLFYARGMIIVYEVDNIDYFFIPSFPEYQSTQKEGVSPYPAPKVVKTNSGPTPVPVQTNSVPDQEEVQEEVQEYEEPTQEMVQAEHVRNLVGQMWGNGDQVQMVIDLIEDHGIDRVQEMAEWCRKNKMRSMTQAINSMRTMGPNWNKKNNDPVASAIEEARKGK